MRGMYLSDVCTSVQQHSCTNSHVSAILYVEGAIAQLVERFVYTEDVSGSSPFSPKFTNLFYHIKYLFDFSIPLELVLYSVIESQSIVLEYEKEVAYGITMVPCTHGCVK